MKPTVRFFLLGALSALFFVLAFPPYGFVPLAFVGLVPFLWAVEAASTAKKAAWVGAGAMISYVLFGFGWVSYVAVSFGGFPWIVGKIVLVLFALFAELQFVAFAIVARVLVKNVRPTTFGFLSFVVMLSSIYVAFDWWYPKIFPNTLGHSLIAWFSVVQIAEFTGAYGLTFLIIAFNASVYFLLRRRHMRVAAITAGALILLFLGFGIWGNHRITQLQALERSFSREFRFSVIQANIGDAEKLESESGFARAIYRVLDTYREMTIDAVKKRPDTDLLIWAETAFPLLYLHFDNPIADQSSIGGRSYIKNVAREAGKPLYFGGYAARGKRDYNSAFLLNSDGKILDYYHKSILLAFGEYVPLGPFSSYIQDLVPAIADFGRGAGPMIMSLPLSERDHVRLAPQICYEGLVPEFSRRSVRDGADVLINITNDSWFGDTSEPHQHLGLTRFRSIELRRPMIRATNTGISAVLGLSGDLNFQTPLFQPTVMQGTIRLPGPEQKFPSTFYARLGEVFAHFASVVALVFLLRNIKTIGRRLRLGRR